MDWPGPGAGSAGVDAGAAGAGLGVAGVATGWAGVASWAGVTGWAGALGPPVGGAAGPPCCAAVSAAAVCAAVAAAATTVWPAALSATWLAVTGAAAGCKNASPGCGCCGAEGPLPTVAGNASCLWLSFAFCRFVLLPPGGVAAEELLAGDGWLAAAAPERFRLRAGLTASPALSEGGTDCRGTSGDLEATVSAVLAVPRDLLVASCRSQRHEAMGAGKRPPALSAQPKRARLACCNPMTR